MVNYDWQGLNYGDYINPPLSVIGRGRHSESIRKQFEADKVAMVEHKTDSRAVLRLDKVKISEETKF
jgi:hypothetical protein